MSTTKPDREPRGSSPVGVFVARAWWSVALIPAFLLGFVILMLFLYQLFGYKPENADAPLWVELVIGLVCVGVFWVPCTAAVIYGSRVVRLGSRRGWWPIGIGASAGIAVTIVTIADAITNAPK